MEVYSLLLVKYVHHGEDFPSFSCFSLLIQLFVSNKKIKIEKAFKSWHLDPSLLLSVSLPMAWRFNSSMLKPCLLSLQRNMIALRSSSSGKGFGWGCWEVPGSSPREGKKTKKKKKGLPIRKNMETHGQHKVTSFNFFAKKSHSQWLKLVFPDFFSFFFLFFFFLYL